MEEVDSFIFDFVLVLTFGGPAAAADNMSSAIGSGGLAGGLAGGADGGAATGGGGGVELKLNLNPDFGAPNV